MKGRYWNFFRNDGKTLILAMDHGAAGAFPVNNPGELIKQTVDAGIDGVLTTYGVIKNYRKEIGKAGAMLRVDVYGSALSGNLFNEEADSRWNIGKAVKELGIDGAMCFGFIGKGIVNGVDYDAVTIKNMAKLAEDCDEYGIISAAEMLVNGFSEDPKDRTIDKMKICCRLAAENGIDFVKTAYVGPVDYYKEVVKNCYVPIIALGGSNAKEEDFLQQCKDAIDAGCKGLAIGRNLWGAKDVAGMTRALVKIVHEDATVEEALKELK